MGVNSKNTNDTGCGNALLWIIGVLVIIFVAPTIYAWLWSAIQFVGAVLAALVLLLIVGLIIIEWLGFC